MRGQRDYSQETSSNHEEGMLKRLYAFLLSWKINIWWIALFLLLDTLLSYVIVKKIACKYDAHVLILPYLSNLAHGELLQTLRSIGRPTWKKWRDIYLGNVTTPRSKVVRDLWFILQVSCTSSPFSAQSQMKVSIFSRHNIYL